MTIEYGLDTSCTADLYPGQTATGVILVVEAAYRRVTTRRGTVIDAPDDGIDLRDYLQAEGTATEHAMIEGMVRSELYKDDRILEGSLVVTASTVGELLTVTIGGFTSNREEFELVIEASGVTVSLLSGGAV